jgi:hypothetical protein
VDVHEHEPGQGDLVQLHRLPGRRRRPTGDPDHAGRERDHADERGGRGERGLHRLRELRQLTVKLDDVAVRFKAVIDAELRTAGNPVIGTATRDVSAAPAS